MDKFLNKINIKGKKYYFYDLSSLKNIKKLPFSYRIFIENLIRNGEVEKAEEILERKEVSFNFRVSRILLQDFTGIPLIADLAALRDYLKRIGKDPEKVNPSIKSHLVVDHSVIVDYFGTTYAYQENVKKEYERNEERYILLKWARENFKNFEVVPPGAGIVHQVNLEYLAEVVSQKKEKGKNILFPDTLLGTDSHTPMVNGLGVLGWGVGGIEAEGVMLGLAYNMKLPKVLGIVLEGKLPPFSTATDLVLTITEILRSKNYPSWIVEFSGEGLSNLSVQDRATISNMAPEYGVLASLFPIDENTIKYLEETGRKKELIERVKIYTKENFLFFDGKNLPEYTETLKIDLSKVKTSISGPKSPHQRNSINEIKEKTLSFIGKKIEEGDNLKDGSVVISAITSCTNTSNPTLMIMAGLLSKKAVEKGLSPKPWVKTSFAPGSKVVTQYLEKAGLLPYMEGLKFHIVGYGCTTCIGNSGPLPAWVEKEIKEKNLITFAVLSGNRNFEGRINPYVKGSFLASPPLVIAFALAGTVLIDLEKEPLGKDPNGKEVFLKDIWPSKEEVERVKKEVLDVKDFKKTYSQIFEGDENWKKLKIVKGKTFLWNEKSTYLKMPPFFEERNLSEPVFKARILAILGDNVTTDHISPAGAIPSDYPAGKY
ncbi:MAG: aconitate hydratase AcnA, partial [Thermoanaerobaculia bacterium]